MTVEDQLRRSSKVTAATVIVAVQAGLLALTGLVVWAASAARRRRFVHRFWYDRIANHPGIAGLVFVLAAAGLVVLAVGLARRQRWVPIPVYVVEGVMVVGNLVRLHPLRSVLGVGVGGGGDRVGRDGPSFFVTGRHDSGVPSAGGDADEIRADGGSHR